MNLTSCATDGWCLGTSLFVLWFLAINLSFFLSQQLYISVIYTRLDYSYHINKSVIFFWYGQSKWNFLYRVLFIRLLVKCTYSGHFKDIFLSFMIMLSWIESLVIHFRICSSLLKVFSSLWVLKLNFFTYLYLFVGLFVMKCYTKMNN